jgi:hypothetical protein
MTISWNNNKQTNHLLVLLSKHSTLLVLPLSVKPPTAKILSSMTAVAKDERPVRMLGITIHVFVLGSYLSQLRLPFPPLPPAHKYILHQDALYNSGLPHSISSVLLHNVSLARPVKKFPGLNGITKLIYHYVHKTQSLGPSHKPFLTPLLVLSSQLRLCIGSCPLHHVSLYISYCIRLILRKVLLLKFVIRYKKAMNAIHKTGYMLFSKSRQIHT